MPVPWTWRRSRHNAATSGTSGGEARKEPEMAENDAQADAVQHSVQTEEEHSEPKWTDDKVDAYVKARIDKQRAKHDAEVASLKAEYDELKAASEKQAGELESMRSERQLSEWTRQVSAETGVPAEVLRGNTLEELKEHAASIRSAYNIHPSANEGSGMPSGKPSNAAILGDFISKNLFATN